MSKLLHKMMARTGRKPEEVRPNSKIGKILSRSGVPWSDEVQRVFELPVREDLDWNWLAAEMTDWLKTPEGEQALRLVQARALTELHDVKGAFCPIPVGEGKTHITFMAPTVVEAERPLLLVPAKLRDKTLWEFEDLAEHWQGCTDMRIESYEKLGRVSGAEILDEYRPDLIIADECQRLKNTKAACTRRVHKYMTAYPKVVFCALSGTITKRSLFDFWHILLWCYGKQNMPLPNTKKETDLWARALDEKIEWNKRMMPGALSVFVDPEAPMGKVRDEHTDAYVDLTQTQARQGYARRLGDTPGVVLMTSTSGVDASLYIDFWDPDLPVEARNKIEEIRKKVELDTRGREDAPFEDCAWCGQRHARRQGLRDTVVLDCKGDVIVRPVDLWRQTRELVLGFHYEWDPQPPEPWLIARREWKGFVRDILAETKLYDSEHHVAQACVRGDLCSQGLYERWAQIRDTFKPKVRTRWVESVPGCPGCEGDEYTCPEHEPSVLGQVRDKLLSASPTLVWVDHVAVGKKLSTMTGIPFFHRGGLDQDKRPLESLAGKSSAICSIASNAEGRNLQAWSRNLVLTPPSTGDIWEQMLGRTHRAGQRADEVECLVLLGHGVLREAMSQAFKDAAYMQALNQAPQKLLLADAMLNFQRL